MKFEVEHKDKVTLVKSKVEKLDALHAPELKGEFVVQSKSGNKNIILDLSESISITSLTKSSKSYCCKVMLQPRLELLLYHQLVAMVLMVQYLMALSFLVL